MQTKYKWTETTIQGIDWAGHKQAVSFLYAHCKESLTKSPPTFLRKFLHGWLATGKMVARYNVTSYPRVSSSSSAHAFFGPTAATTWFGPLFHLAKTQKNENCRKIEVPVLSLLRECVLLISLHSFSTLCERMNCSATSSWDRFHKKKHEHKNSPLASKHQIHCFP
jgi:hypothetical protein